ncbi:MAG: thiamine-phosphate kinase [Acidobacteria bacterium]|nr:thiamine-phosphate kinase [Acidobacteriota bacterium]
MKTEFELIKDIKNKSSAIRNRQSAIRIGIGDDCAVLPKDAKTDLVITTDLLVEDIDFRLDWTIPEFLGHKALAVSLSDIAAMGANPIWAMLSIGIPEKIWKLNFVEKFYDGWFALAAKYKVELIGGDISKTPDKIVIDSIVAGEVKKGKAVLRSTAKPNDLIFVTGKLGGAAAGLQLLENGERWKNSKNLSARQKLLLRQLKPEPQIEIGEILSEKNLATAMIDLSDGLSSDLAHLCRESKVGARIFADKIPLEENFPQKRKGAKNELRINNYKLRGEKNSHSAFRTPHLDGGEDFELLFTVNPKKILRLKNALNDFSFTHIGEVTETVEKIELISRERTEILTPGGFRHF